MLKLVIVEDEDIIRKSLVHTIDWMALGCTVAGEAENGRRGLEVILAQRPHIVLTDIKMPVMDGIDMLREAACHYEFESLILTGFGEFEFARQALRLRVSEYLLKPLDETLLAEAVRKAVAAVKAKSESKRGFAEYFALVQFDGLAANLHSASPVRVALSRIQDSFQDKLSVESIAAELNISPSYLHRKIREETGCTFLHLLHSYRVQKSIVLMAADNLRLYEISAAVGFTDYKHFCAVFKKIVGAAPTEFIKSLAY